MSLPYYFDENIKRITDLEKQPGSNRTNMLAMSDNDFNRLKWSLPSTTRFMRDFEATVKAVDKERRNDYVAMVKEARKRFNKLDIAILELLHANDEGAYYFRGVKSHVTEAIIGVHPKLTQDEALKKSLKLLMRRGLVKVVNGLFDDDGYVAGSGYAAVDHKRDVIERIIETYNGPEQSSLI